MVSSAISADLGRQELIQGNSEALATVTGIVDGTGSIGAAVGQVRRACEEGLGPSGPRENSQHCHHNLSIGDQNQPNGTVKKITERTNVVIWATQVSEQARIIKGEKSQ